MLINVGGPKAGIVAFDLDGGKEIWRATSDPPSYSSPVVTSVDGTRLAVFFTRTGAVVLDPRTGDVRYQKRWRARYDASVNAATPLIIDDLAFFSTCYETGALLVKLRKNGADELWTDENVMSNHYNTCIYNNGLPPRHRWPPGIDAEFPLRELEDEEDRLGKGPLRLRHDDPRGRSPDHPDRIRRPAPGASHAGRLPRTGPHSPVR